MGCFCVGVVMTPLREGQIIRLSTENLDRLWRSPFVSLSDGKPDTKFLIYDLVTETDPETGRDVLCALLVKVSYGRNRPKHGIAQEHVTLTVPRDDWHGDLIVHYGQQMYGRLVDMEIVSVEGEINRYGMGMVRAALVCSDHEIPMTGARWVEYPLWFEDGFDPVVPEVRV